MKLNDIIKWNDTLSFIPNVLNKQIYAKWSLSLGVGWIWNLRSTTDLGNVNRLSLTAIVIECKVTGTKKDIYIPDMNVDILWANK